jgi:hypothetical protein
MSFIQKNRKEFIYCKNALNIIFGNFVLVKLLWILTCTLTFSFCNWYARNRASSTSQTLVVIDYGQNSFPWYSFKIDLVTVKILNQNWSTAVFSLFILLRFWFKKLAMAKLMKQKLPLGVVFFYDNFLSPFQVIFDRKLFRQKNFIKSKAIWCFK